MFEIFFKAVIFLVETAWSVARESSSLDPSNKQESTSEAKDEEDKSLVRLTKAERRQKLKKLKREAKKPTKEEVKDDQPAEKSLHSEVLVIVCLHYLVYDIKSWFFWWFIVYVLCNYMREFTS